MVELVGGALASECGPSGCPRPPRAVADGAPVQVDGVPPLDQRPPAHLEVATFALG